jgi:hypothetical protein
MQFGDATRPFQNRIMHIEQLKLAGLTVIGASSLLYAIGLTLLKTAAWVWA